MTGGDRRRSKRSRRGSPLTCLRAQNQERARRPRLLNSRTVARTVPFGSLRKRKLLPEPFAAHKDAKTCFVSVPRSVDPHAPFRFPACLERVYYRLDGTEAVSIFLYVYAGLPSIIWSLWLPSFVIQRGHFQPLHRALTRGFENLQPVLSVSFYFPLRSPRGSVVVTGQEYDYLGHASVLLSYIVINLYFFAQLTHSILSQPLSHIIKSLSSLTFAIRFFNHLCTGNEYL